MTSQADGEEAPLFQDGAPHRDYQSGVQHSDKKRGSPLLPILGGHNATYQNTQYTDMDAADTSPPVHSVNADHDATSINFGRTRPASDAVSVTNFGGGGLTASIIDEADPQNLQDVLDSLERASVLIRRYMHKEEEMQSQPRSRPLIPRWVTRYLLVITFIWQTLNIGFLEAVEHIKADNSTIKDLDLASNVVMTAFQTVHILLVFFVSFKLVKQVMHRSASGSLLAQSYLSMVLLFAGLYTLQYRFNNSGFNFVYHHRSPILLFLRMLYFSVSTATLCGTSEVEPADWYSNLTVSLQMLMSFVYFASILSLALVTRRPTTGQGRSRERSYTNKLRKARQWVFGSGDAL